MRRGSGLPATIPPLVTILLMTATRGSAADVSFASDVAPALVETCSGCHGDDRPRAGFSVTTFGRLMRGGQSGPAIVAGKGAESLLVKKIRGTGIEGQRMPIGRPPLSVDLIASVEKWIDQGAKLDVLSAQDTLAAVVSAGRMQSMPHEALQEIRFAGARKIWRRALPDEDPVVAKRGDLLVIGNLEPAQASVAADAAATAWADVQRLLAADQKPLLKGGAVVYVFGKPVDYSAFWQEVLADERPKGLTGNAGAVDEVAYAAFVMPEAADLEAVAAEQLAAAAFLVRGAPAWFASGAGRMVAMKIAPRAPAVKAWRHESAEQLRRIGDSPDDYFGDHPDPVVVAAIGAGFVPSFVRSETRLAGLIKSLDAGVTFERAFADAFKEEPRAIYSRWAAKAAKKSGSGRR